MLAVLTRFLNSATPALIRRLLAGEEVSASGPWPIEQARVGPLPPQPVDVWLGGAAEPALSRAARLADAWIAVPDATAGELSGQVASYRAACETHGRQPSTMVLRRDVHVGADDADTRRVARRVIERGYRGLRPEVLVVGGPDHVAGELRHLASLGFTYVLVRLCDLAAALRRCGLQVSRPSLMLRRPTGMQLEQRPHVGSQVLSRHMEQRVSLITLGVVDLGRSRSFYEQLGWRGQEVEETVFFQAGGQAIVLWGRDKVAADAGIVDEGSSGFGGIVLAHNVASREQVDEVVNAAEASGGEVTRPPSETFYGGYAGFFRDLDGHVWEVAHNPGFILDDDGALTLPDLASAT